MTKKISVILGGIIATILIFTSVSYGENMTPGIYLHF